MMAKRIKIVELRYPVFQFLIIYSSYNKSQKHIVFIQDKINYMNASH